MHISRVPVVKVVWAWWRYREARLKRPKTLPPVIEQFSDNELIPLKGFVFRVAYRDEHAIVLAPVSFTGQMRKRLSARLREQRDVAEQKAV